MPEAVAIRPVVSADLVCPTCLIGKDRHRFGPEKTLNNGRGCVVDAHASGTADGIVVGVCPGRLAVSAAEGGFVGLTGHIGLVGPAKPGFPIDRSGNRAAEWEGSGTRRKFNLNLL